MAIRSKRYVQDLALEQRKEPTEAEARLWIALRNKNLDGVKFHRQRAWGRFILEFYAPSSKLVVEIDGEIHRNKAQHEKDIIRDRILAAKGLRVLRFSNEQILGDLENCLDQIREMIAQ
jgi:very-short-patch-repair endonuclease